MSGGCDSFHRGSSQFQGHSRFDNHHHDNSGQFNSNYNYGSGQLGRPPAPPGRSSYDTYDHYPSSQGRPDNSYIHGQNGRFDEDHHDDSNFGRHGRSHQSEPRYGRPDSQGRPGSSYSHGQNRRFNEGHHDSSHFDRDNWSTGRGSYDSRYHSEPRHRHPNHYNDLSTASGQNHRSNNQRDSENQYHYPHGHASSNVPAPHALFHSPPAQHQPAPHNTAPESNADSAGTFEFTDALSLLASAANHQTD
jgi:hypothetical protein